MRRITGWIIGGLLTLALWAPGVGAQPLPQAPLHVLPHWRAVRHDRHVLYQARQQLRRDRWAGNADAIAADRAALRRARATLRADRRALHRDRRAVRQARDA